MLRVSGVVPVFAPRREADKKGFLGRAPGYGCVIPPAGTSARDVLAAADAALVASGTATLEATLCNTPMAAVYRLSPSSAILARLALRAPYVALPSWIAGRKVVPELLQDQVTGPKLAAMALELLDPVVASRQRADLGHVRRLVGGPGAARRVARLVAGYLS